MRNSWPIYLKIFQIKHRKKKGIIKMRIVIDFLIFALAFLVFNWLMKKIGIHEKFLNKAIKVKHYKFILICIFFIFMFLLEYGKQSLYDLYGRRNWISISFAGVLGSIYVNCIPFMFKKNN